MKEIADIVRFYEAHPGEPFALATLVEARGSSYRRPGARMLISRAGTAVGSLSGGCLENEVIERSLAVLQTSEAQRVSFDTRRRFGCNGSLEILVERASSDLLAGLAHHFHTRQSIGVVSSFATGNTRIAELEKTQSGELWQRIDPLPQLIVIGSGPDSEALQAMAAAMGWWTSHLESAHELAESYDAWTAAVVKTHNYGRDFAALRTLLSMDLRYVGLLGPSARREQLLEDLYDTGIAPGRNLFAPAGLDLGGDAPEAIALSIIAEIQVAFGGGTRLSLRDRKAPIHAPLAEAAMMKL